MTLAGLISRLGTFAANVVVIRLLGLDMVGRLGVIESWLSLLAMFAIFGINAALTRHVAYYRHREPDRLGELVLSAFCLGIVLSFLVDAFFFLATSSSTMGAWASSFRPLNIVRDILVAHTPVVMALVLVSTLRSLFAGLINGLQQFALFAWVSIITGVISLPIYYVMARWRGLDGVLVARLVLAAIEIFVMFIISRPARRNMGTKLTLRGFSSNSRLLLGFGSATFVGQIASNPVQTFMTSLLAAQTGGIMQVGLLTAANRLVGLANFLPGSMAAVTMPVLATEHGKEVPSQFGDSVAKAIRVMWISGLPIFIFFMSISAQVLPLLYGPAYALGSAVAFISLLIALLGTVNQGADSALAAANRQWISTTTNFIWAIMFLLLGVVLVPNYLAIGYVAAWLISLGLYLVLELGCLRLLFNAPLRSLFPITILTSISVAAAFVVARYAYSLISAIGLGTLVALLCILLIWRWVLAHSERYRLQVSLNIAFAHIFSRIGVTS